METDVNGILLTFKCYPTNPSESSYFFLAMNNVENFDIGKQQKFS